MITTMEKRQKQEKDIRVLQTFIGVYCRGKHKRPKGVLCNDCFQLLEYAKKRREKCPLDPKPSCKHCHIHCYSREYREKIRQIMAFSGRKMIMRGRLDYLWHYFF